MPTTKPLSGVKLRWKILLDPANPILVQMNEMGNDFIFQIEPNKTYKITATKSATAV